MIDGRTWRALLALLFVGASVPAWAAETPPFARPESEQRALEQELGRPEGTPLTEAGARALLDQTDRALAHLPQLVQEHRTLFADYHALVERVRSERDALKKALALPPGPAREQAIREVLPRLRAAAAALVTQARAAYEGGLKSFMEEFLRPPVLVVSGGVSLGSYQAGLLYLYTEYLRHSAELLQGKIVGTELPLPSRFVIATGASAGSINAFLAALSGCLPSPKTPEDSLLYQTWIPVGTDVKNGLYDPAAVTGNSILSQTPLIAAVKRVEDLWKDPSTPWGPCKFQYGAPVTSLQARFVPVRAGLRPELSGNFQVPLPTEHFLLTISNGERPAPPKIQAFVPSGYEQLPFYPALAVEPGKDIPVGQALDILRSSAAFPLAFSPRQLSYSWAGSDKRQHRDAWFVDGGVFDNNPLGMALGFEKWTERIPLRGRILFINSDAISFERSSQRVLTEAPAPKGDGDLGATFGSFLNNYLGVASNAQLLAAIESDDKLPHRLDIPLRTTEVPGEFLIAFSGFLEEDFRVFDFYRGMVDAYLHLTKQSPLAAKDAGIGDFMPDIKSPIYKCFLAYSGGTPPPECDEVKRTRPNLIALLQATWEPLPAASDQRLAEFEHRLREYGYVFQPDDPIKKAGGIAPAVRHYAGILTDILASKQDTFGGRQVTATAAENGLDLQVQYQPPPPFLTLGLVTGGVEVVGSLPLVHWGRDELRLRLGFRLLPLGRQVVDDATVLWRSDGQPTAHLAFGFPLGDVVRLEVLLGVLGEGSVVWSGGPRFYSARVAAEAGLGVLLAQRLELQARPLLYLGEPLMGSGFGPPPGGAQALGWSISVGLRL